MGNPLEIVTFGVPSRSGDGRLYTRYPQGNAPNSGATAQGLGASVSVSAAQGLADGGEMEFALVDLVDGWDHLNFEQDSGGSGTAQWTTDDTGGFARITWVNNGTRGLRWRGGMSTQHNQIYIKFDLRRYSTSYNTKQLKIFGRGNLQSPQQPYSNFTFGPQRTGYDGGTGAGGVVWSDSPSGGDNSASPSYGGYTSPPSTGGGGSFSRTPYPTQTVTTPGVTQAINDWDTWEMFVRYNDDGINNGIIAVRKAGVLIFRYDNVWNCGTGLQWIGGFSLGEYATTAGAIEDFRRVYASWNTPAWLS